MDTFYFRKDVSSQNTMQNRISLGYRISYLFSFGVFLALLLNFLQKQKGITIFSPGVFGDVLNSAWWIPPTFGIASGKFRLQDDLVWKSCFTYICVYLPAAVGLLLPFLDRTVGQKSKLFIDWPCVMRCIALFVGFNHAIAVSFPLWQNLLPF